MPLKIPLMVALVDACLLSDSPVLPRCMAAATTAIWSLLPSCTAYTPSKRSLGFEKIPNTVGLKVLDRMIAFELQFTLEVICSSSLLSGVFTDLK